MLDSHHFAQLQNTEMISFKNLYSIHKIGERKRLLLIIFNRNQVQCTNVFKNKNMTFPWLLISNIVFCHVLIVMN